MTITTLWKYLFGNRQAILDMAGCRQSIWVGFLFVLSAALAREYDGADLWHEPWHLALPLAASLVTSFLLFLLVSVVARIRGCTVGPFAARYRSFLGLYWMTAPLAWWYAIPVERFLAPASATAANLWLLALVSLWRVGLMTRVIAVLFNARAWPSFFVVMFFADTVALVILRLTPLPIFQLMGGIRLSPSEQTIQATAFLVGFIGIISWPVWLIGLIVISGRRRGEWKPEFANRPATMVRPSLWGLAGGSLAGWILVLPLTQPEQRLKWRVERDLRNGRLQGAVVVLVSHERSDFPPHWDPPPRLGYGETHPRAKDVLKALAGAEIRPWVTALFSEKFANETRTTVYEDIYGPFSEHLSDDELDEYLAILEHLPERSQVVREHDTAFERECQNELRSPAIRGRIRVLYQEAGFESPDRTTTQRPAISNAPGDSDPEMDRSDPNAEPR